MHYMNLILTTNHTKQHEITRNQHTNAKEQTTESGKIPVTDNTKSIVKSQPWKFMTKITTTNNDY
ncbi:11078_t:CDS:2 [Gigaspora margarita]|uniref:11078_t:CDS:1 n=1 Tax=Gigaspora margarita TaxID=4874 RepID=A0ABN7UWU8_GIGMA|nr:11078_t:CDS:2 [Gigaspora margarita]